MANVRVEGVAVSRGGRPLLHGVDLSIASGQRMALLGSSGAGKTTLLRAIAGTFPVDRGTISLDGTDIRQLDESQRGIALVPQSAALLPHRNVSGNIGFPLEIRRVGRAEVDRRVRAQARAFSLHGLLRRRSSQLSEGESAEVALARALVHRTRLLLLDEPFSRLGDPGRDALIRDLIEMQEGYGATLLLATNDPRVAELVAPTIAVIARGRIVQVATPRELVERPASLEVAWLAADGPLNLLPAELTERDGVTLLRSGTLELPTWDLVLGDHAPSGVQIAIRPSDLHLGDEPGQPSVTGRVTRHAFLGSTIDVAVATDDAQLLVRAPRPVPPVGASVDVVVPSAAVHVFDRDGDAISHGV